ncbi:MAG: hypothetical protein IPF41_17185 [Flavobacteriales bacterium]|nr:hypothetical protein [Flavobacteriales bacterium]
MARTVNEVAITSGEPVTIADLSIDGMSCEGRYWRRYLESPGQAPGCRAPRSA